MNLKLHAWRLRVFRFAERDIWERDLDEFGRMERPFVTFLRLSAVVRDGFSRHQLTMRAGALTYVTIFSLVPTLAVALSMFSAFGGLQSAKQMLLSKIAGYLAVGVRDQATARLNMILENVHGGAIGATGFVFVVIAVVSLMSSMEDAFDDIWGVKRSRSYFERLTVYWTVVTIAPTLLVLGVSLPALFHRLAPLEWILEQTGTAEIFFSRLLPLVVICSAFALMYYIMTSTRVPPAAAAIGGLFSGTLWSAAAFGYSWYIRSTVYYSNVYGSLSALPIFVFWLYLAWLIVLLGAQVAFASQNIATYREELLAPNASMASRELLALRILAEASKRFISAAEPPTPEDLPQELKVSGRLVNRVVDRLLESGLLLEVGEHRQLIPSRDPGQIKPGEVVRRLREEGDVRAWREKDDTTAEIESRWQEAEAAALRKWDGLTFAQLVSDGDRSGRHKKSEK